MIPVWDSPYVDLLERAVGAIRSQAPDVRIVIVDNASDAEVGAPEGTEVIRTPHRLSAGEARNYGLRRVETELVMFLDADDELLDGALEIVRGELAADPELSVFAMSLREAASGRRHRFPRRLAFALTRFPRTFALATSIWSMYSTQGCAVFRTEEVRESGGYADLSGPEDWVLGVSQAFRGRVRLDRRPGLIYHRHPHSLARAQETGYMLLAARQVRARLRSDPAVPRWARALLPLIAVLQSLVIVILRPGYRGLRRLTGAR